MKPLHHKTHTFAKRGLSLLCVLALCLSLLPVTALAAAPDGQVIYVGNENVTSGGYWTTDSNGNVTPYTGEGTTPSDNYIHYDKGANTLTLHNATIKESLDYTDSNGDSSFINSSAIGVLNQHGNAELTIQLEGSNTIAEVSQGIYVLAHSQSTGSSSLTITGNGSLDTSGSQFCIRVQSNSSDAALSIENAKVTATVVDGYGGNGVFVQSSENSSVSLTVNSGSLTATGRYADDAGILLQFGSGGSGSGTPTVTVSGNAVVDAKNGGIANNSSSPIQYETGSDSTGGIVWNGSEGTVYGSVTLGENFTISEGESLTIGNDASLTVPDGTTLTNNGTVTTEGGGTLTNNGKIDNGGTLPETISGNQLPEITAQPQSVVVTTGQTAEFTVVASASEGDALSYQWQQKTTDSGSDWTNVGSATSSNTYIIDNTTTSMNGYQYRCVVTGSAGSVTSSAATLTINAPTTYTITAAASPADGGTVDGNGDYVEGSSVILKATANSDYRFVGWMENDQQVSADATYTFPASSNRTLTAKFEKVYNVTVNSTAGGTATADKTTAAVGETVTLTANPNSGYRFTGWTFSDNITGTDASSKTTNITMPDGDVTATANFDKIPSVTPSTPPTVSEETTDAIQDAQPGETVTVDLSSGSTKLDKEVFETLAGKDVNLVVDLGDGVSWTVKGSDIPEDADFTDIDMGVTMNSDGIPVEVVNAITGERDSVQLELAHDGAFGFTMTLTAPLGAENAGYWANLYHFDEEANAMTFEMAAPIGSDGSVSLALSHASQYAIVIDDHNHGVVTLPFTDVSADDWFYDPVCYVYSQGLMTGTSATTFEPNTPLSRAMLVAVLHRLEGSPQASAGDFSDVADGDWYAQAVNWAASVGVVNGFDDGTFQPNTAITREQLAAILRNYAQYKGLDVTASGDLAHYSDAASISDWAKESVTWAVGENLISGVTNDTLAPQACATRAQVAAILQRYLSE